MEAGAPFWAGGLIAFSSATAGNWEGCVLGAGTAVFGVVTAGNLEGNVFFLTGVAADDDWAGAVVDDDFGFTVWVFC